MHDEKRQNDTTTSTRTRNEFWYRRVGVGFLWTKDEKIYVCTKKVFCFCLLFSFCSRWFSIPPYKADFEKLIRTPAVRECGDQAHWLVQAVVNQQNEWPPHYGKPQTYIWGLQINVLGSEAPHVGSLSHPTISPVETVVPIPTPAFVRLPPSREIKTILSIIILCVRTTYVHTCARRPREQNSLSRQEKHVYTGQNPQRTKN